MKKDSFKKISLYKKILNEIAEELTFNTLSLTLKGALENYKRSNSNLWVSSLCYFSIMGLIPILAILFSVSKWLNIDTYLMEKLIENSPLDKNNLTFLMNIAQNLLAATKSGVLAGFGFFFLGFSIISMFSIIEKSFNSIWQVKSSKNFRKKVGDYFILFITFTFILFCINRVSQLNLEFFNYPFVKNSIPYMALWIFFMIFYSLMPNIRVNLQYTIVSGFFVSLLFNQSNLLLIKLQTIILNYNKIYGSFSIILIFLIWLKIVWFIILIGAHFTFILQNRFFLKNIYGINAINFKSKFYLIVQLIILFSKNFNQGKAPLALKDISTITEIPPGIALELITFLKDKNIILEVNNESNNGIDNENDNEKLFKLARDCSEFSLKDIKILLEDYGIDYEFSDKKLLNATLDTKINELL